MSCAERICATSRTLLRRRLAQSTIDGAFSALSGCCETPSTSSSSRAIRRRGCVSVRPTRAWAPSAGLCGAGRSLRMRSVHGARRAEVARLLLGAGHDRLPAR